MKKVIIVMGPPGCGKGTQASLLKEKYQIAHISTGELFREEIRKASELGVLAKSYIDQGKYVPDDVTIGMLEHRIKSQDCNNGFILDGFPRTIPQAEYLDKMLQKTNTNITAVIYYNVRDNVVVERIKGRAEKDRLAGKPVRDDDINPITIQKRLETYHMQTAPVLKYYENSKRLLTIDAEKGVEEIFKSTKI